MCQSERQTSEPSSIASRTSGSAKVRISAGRSGIDRIQELFLADAPCQREARPDKERQDQRRISGIGQNEFVPFAHAVILRRCRNRQSSGAGDEFRSPIRVWRWQGAWHSGHRRRAARPLPSLPQDGQEPRHVRRSFAGIVNSRRQLARMTKSCAHGNNHPDVAPHRFFFCARRPTDQAVVNRQEDRHGRPFVLPNSIQS